MTPRELADNCVGHLQKERLQSMGPVGQEMQMMGVTWHILELQSNNAAHPGRIADYAGSMDFDVDLKLTDRGFTAKIVASGKFDS
jgi:hypothetical protein